MTDFKDLNLKPELEKALSKLHYVTPTPIQLQAIPGLMKGNDLIGIAQTGTGKTAAFTLPILHQMKEEYPRKIKTLVIAPTRELAAQIGESFAKYGEFLKFKHTTIFGGVKQGRQVEALKKGVDILVATPGRLMDLLNQGKLSLKEVEFFVLDEADRMLDMGFIHDIRKVIAKLPHRRQSLFFSATMSPQVNTLARSLLRDPIHVEVTPQATTVERITQEVYFVDQKSKDKLLLELLEEDHLTSILVFTRTKHKANKVAVFLNKNKIPAEAIHGNKSQGARTRAIKNFKSGEVKVLVATDIAARGIDIDNISHVINYELPNEAESYVHRIGRTARAGTDGAAFSFCSAEERDYLRSIVKLIKQELEVIKHKYHSEKAEYAVGEAARPPKKQRRGQRNRSSKPRNNNENKGGSGNGSKRPFTKTYKGKKKRGGNQRRQSTRR
ncbi:DEAD/DEAH box helicase [Candidatus Woesearchaeota archaeon]|jgi:ATP-dependent RNA helicase RhlE|nr:DEAD/DEAH box helicase [Candidatus Woesearchaeota archaeon]MBT4151348.1 DEAD/DEAH box helicase [Candidatus Woesearchaeota archaeon]MBT4247746.1 DEAD/DEAH box helicase [Candidatus Woesearchaeota archaeon]MBT4434170.1 DEAD/DEAH box helicase [Candidatus Woesearchaeota archaeon]MBT7332487.1 DEAD/DEAH box helicase [Candidatus Woesearchaeota archaeon]